MVTFGLVSTAFDLMTFGVLWKMVGDSPATFRTGWFLESLLTELLILFIIRTFKPFYQSVPVRFLALSAVAVSVVAFLLPYTPAGEVMGFVPLSPQVLLVILAIVVCYIAISEMTKQSLFRLFR
jgi:Mg2+-importing ATPase